MYANTYDLDRALANTLSLRECSTSDHTPVKTNSAKLHDMVWRKIYVYHDWRLQKYFRQEKLSRVSDIPTSSANITQDTARTVRTLSDAFRCQ